MEYLKLGSEDRFRGPEPAVLSILGRKIRIWQDERGAWQAMEMVCRHQNSDLSAGERDGDIITCPRHGWRYDLTTGNCLTAGWAGLRRFDVKAEDGALLVSTRPIAD